MRSILPLCLALAAIPSTLAENRFIQPPGPGPEGNYRDNPIYELGDKVDVQWESDIDYMDIILWQDYPRAGGDSSWFRKLRENSRSTSFIWTVDMDGFSTNVTNGESPVLYWTIYKYGVNQIQFVSHYFNISLESAATSTLTDATTSLSAAEPDVPTQTTGTSTESADAVETTDPASTETSEASQGLSTGAVAGIAVGATIAGIALLAGIGFMIWRRKRKNNAVPNTPQSQFAPSAYEDATRKHELAANTHVHSPGGHPYAQGPGGLHEAP